jgi:hypothetical protein
MNDGPRRTVLVEAMTFAFFFPRNEILFFGAEHTLRGRR